MRFGGYEVRSDIPGDVALLLYLLDEVISHFVMFTGLYAMLALFALMECIGMRRILEIKIGRASNVFAIAGVLFGASLCVGAVEAQMVYYVMFLNVLILVYVFILVREYGVVVRLKDLRRVGFTFFLVVSCLSFLLTAVVYYFVVGGFVQPSEMLRGG